MANTRGPSERPRESVARRAYRHPGTGHWVALLVERRGTSGGPRERLWRVWLEDAPGSPATVAKLRFLSVHETRGAARRAFAERQRALIEAGYERVYPGAERVHRGDRP